MKRTPNRRGSQERRWAHGRNPRGDRRDLEWDRSEALGDDDPYAPFLDQVLIGGKAVPITVQLHKPRADQTPQSVADYVADDSAQRGGDSADEGQRPDLLRPHERHRDKQQVGWDGQKRAVSERNRRKRPPAVTMSRKRFHIPHQAAAPSGGDYLLGHYVL